MEKNLYMYNATMIYDISVYAYICVMCALSLTSCAYVFRDYHCRMFVQF